MAYFGKPPDPPEWAITRDITSFVDEHGFWCHAPVPDGVHYWIDGVEVGVDLFRRLHPDVLR